MNNEARRAPVMTGCCCMGHGGMEALYPRARRQ